MTEKSNVLIVCRTAAGQMYLGILLSRIWHTPTLARTAEDGVRLAQKKEFSLIVFDGDLQDRERQAALSLLRSHAAVKDLPLVLFITRENTGSTESLLSAGCTAIITKPVNLAEVYGLLSRLCKQPRTTLRAPVKFLVRIDEEIPEKELACINISEGGVYLRTLQPLPEMTQLHLSFSLPYSAEVVCLVAEVVRTAQLGAEFDSEPGMGLRFVDISDHSRMQIRHFVQWAMIGDLEWSANI